MYMYMYVCTCRFFSKTTILCSAHCAVCGYAPCVSSHGLQLRFTVQYFAMSEGAKLLTTSMSAVEWYKSCAHISSFLSKVIANSYICVPTQCEQNIAVVERASLKMTLLRPRKVSLYYRKVTEGKMYHFCLETLQMCPYCEKCPHPL